MDKLISFLREIGSMPNMPEFITAMPKSELHVHIEGTIEADLLLAIADRNGIRLPYKTATDNLTGQSEGKTDAKQNLIVHIDKTGLTVLVKNPRFSNTGLCCSRN